jgi:uncharacterized protein (TIGR02246 family)
MNRLVCALAFCVLAVPAFAQDKASIEKLNAAFVAAFAKGDAAALAAMYTDDASLLPAGAEMVKGRPGIQAFWSEAVKGLASAKLTTSEVLPLGPEYAEEIGAYTLETKAQPPQTITGKYVVIWRKVGGDWKLATDIWNSNK